jgi:hypothetical protein
MVMSRSRPLLPAVLVALTVSALVVGVSPAAAAAAGNAANAKLCQKGGWRDLVTSTGADFASERDCVSYAVQGGTPLTRYQYLQSQYQAICEQRGLFFLNGEAAWGCRSSTGTSIRTATTRSAHHARRLGEPRAGPLPTASISSSAATASPSTGPRHLRLDRAGVFSGRSASR